MSQRTARRSAVAAAAVLGAAALVDTRVWAWALWRAIWGLAADHPVLTAAGAPAIAVLAATAAVGHRHRHAEELTREEPSNPAPARRWHWLLSYPGVVTIALAVALIGVAAFLVMLRIAADTTAAERPKLQIEAIKYGLGFFAAGGAVAALLLAVRRQQHTEDAQAHTELDATERRVTDIYTKAVEQIGSPDAAVRLGGLYALERVAQNNPSQRQTIVNVLCAYLRMPYTPPTSPTTDTGGPLTQLPLATSVPATAGERDARQELQVRLTAQRILTDHLRTPDDCTPREAGGAAADPQRRFWPRIDLDLTGAHLIDWNLYRSSVRTASFDRVTFTGDAVFSRATFHADARFSGATFTGAAVFRGPTFTGDADFGRATFTGDAEFSGAMFASDAMFGEATFHADAVFNRATFHAAARFSRATFHAAAEFSGAMFHADARFSRATFHAAAEFSGATFAGDADFSRATFHFDAMFGEVTFTGDAWFRGAMFHAAARFRGATFHAAARFREATFHADAEFSGATFAGDAEFSEATFHADGEFSGATFHADARFTGTTFTGDARFGGATFGSPPGLQESRIMFRPDRADAWPLGWHLVVASPWGRLVYEQPVPSPGEGSAGQRPS